MLIKKNVQFNLSKNLMLFYKRQPSSFFHLISLGYLIKGKGVLLWHSAANLRSKAMVLTYSIGVARGGLVGTSSKKCPDQKACLLEDFLLDQLVKTTQTFRLSLSK